MIFGLFIHSFIIDNPAYCYSTGAGTLLLQHQRIYHEEPREIPNEMLKDRRSTRDSMGGSMLDERLLDGCLYALWKMAKGELAIWLWELWNKNLECYLGERTKDLTPRQNS